MDFVESHIGEFEDCLSFCENTPPAGWESHIRTMRLRERFRAAADAVDDDEFLASLRKTLPDRGLR